MPSGVSDYGSGALLSALVGITAPITRYWVALCTDEPGPGMDGDVLGDLEPDDTAYARMLYGTGNALWSAQDGYVTTLADLTFPTPTVDWATVTHYALCTAPTSGELIAWGEFLEPQYVAAGLIVTIPAGGIVIALDQLDDPITL
jgi:hypothetical protein